MAVPTMLEQSRTHTVAGAFGSIGGVITSATNATPVVITTTSAHGLITGDFVQVAGVTTNTGANGSYAVIVTSPTVFSLTGSVGNGVAGLGSATVSQALDISGISGDYSVKLRVESLTAAKKIQIAIQDSVDGFVNDIVTRGTINVAGQILTASMRDVLELRSYDIPSMRFGTANAKMRLNVLAIDSTATAVVTCWYES